MIAPPPGPGRALPRPGTSRRWALLLPLLAWLCLPAVSAASTFLPETAEPQSPEQIESQGLDSGEEFISIDDMVFRTGDVIEAGFRGNPWTGGVVYYSFDSTVDGAEPSQWLAAAAKWSEVANVTFVQRTNQTNYVVVHDSGPSGGNNSFVGMIGGAQTMNISNWGYTFIIAHEIGHALGLMHEHQRSDRNTYVTINSANIQAGASGNFTLQSTTNYGNYDFDSVMHYDRCAFSIDCPAGTSCACTHPTITVLPPNQSWQGMIGQITHLSYYDQRGMGLRYGCLTPASPLPLTPADGTTGAPNTGIFDWTNTAGASAYWLVVLCAAGDTAISVRVPSSSYSYYLPNGSYTWQVFTFNPCELVSPPFLVFSLGVGTGSGATCHTPVPLDPASGSVCQPVAGLLRWNTVAGATGYYVRLATACGSGTETFTLAPEMSYSGLAMNTSYRWQVRAVCPCATAAYSACATFITEDDQPPVAPLPQTPAPGATGQPLAGTLYWGAPSHAAGFRVQLGTSCGTGTEYDVDDPTFDYSGLAQGVTYYWRVMARNACDLWSPYSSCHSFSTTTLAGADRIYLGSGQSLAVGQTLAEIPVRIENLADLRGFGFRLQMDPAVFDYLGWSLADTRASGAANATASFSPGGGGQPAEVVVDLHFPAGLDCPPQIAGGDGVVFRVRVAVKPSAPLGPTPVTFAAGSFAGCGGSAPLPALAGGSITIATPTLAAPDPTMERPGELRLQSEGANPAHGSVAFRIGLPAAAPIAVGVFDLSGREVARLAEGMHAAGWHRLAWDGAGADGRPAPNGIYLVRLASGMTRRSMQVVLLR